MNSTPDGLSDSVCEFLAQTSYDDLPDATRIAAKRAILDATGVIIAASGLSADTLPFIRLARSATGPCTLLGYDDLVLPQMAAFGNGAMAHALDFEDAFDRAPCHPNAAAVPAAIAIAQAYGPVDGREFVTAITVGCELACRMALSLRQGLEENGWYPPTILGAFGAAAAAARLLKLSAAQIRDALSLTLCQVTAPGEIKNSPGTVVRAVREAFPAQAAVISAVLAREGVRGFEAPLEGQDGFFRLYADGNYEPGALLDGLGSDLLIGQLSFKPWPTCRGTHAYVEIALGLRQKYGFRWTDIESVVVDTGPVQQMLVDPLIRKQAPQTIIDAKFSIPFVVAMTFVRGRVTLEDFSDDVLGDPDILQMASHISPRAHPDWGTGHATNGALTVTLTDGRALSGQVDNALGSPATPIATEALEEKFLGCCAHAASAADLGRAKVMAAEILALEEYPDCGSCFRL
ncbi:MAG: MmgE/PrpD family protein [Gammaproteobacteria bacterium]